VLGVPPFVVLGHLFVVVMTWQLAVVYVERLGLRAHPVLLPTLAWYFTAAFAMLMENTGVVGRWWTWNMPSWWFFPNMFGAPLIDLPWDRPITQAWGYFISSFWLVLLATDLPRRWTPARILALLAGLAVVLELARLTPFRAVWSTAIMPGLPFVSVLLGKPLGLPVGSDLLRERRIRWSGAVPLGLAAMVVVCVVQIGAVHKWQALVSLFPMAMLVLGLLRPAPWLGVAVSAGVVLLGFWLNSGNVLLAGWLVLRCSAFLAVLLIALRWRSTRPSSRASIPVPALSSSSTAP
jgi:hypothetical protein